MGEGEERGSFVVAFCLLIMLEFLTTQVHCMTLPNNKVIIPILSE